MVERLLAGVVFGGLFLVLGCGGGGTPRDAGNPGSGGTAGGAAGGSTGTGGATSIDPTPFLGAWNETQTLRRTGPCSDGSPALSEAMGSAALLVIAGSSNSEIVRTETSGSNPCSIRLEIVSSTQATLARSMNCTSSTGGISATTTFTTWSMTISGNTGTESASGVITLLALTCPISMTASLAR